MGRRLGQPGREGAVSDSQVIGQYAGSRWNGELFVLVGLVALCGGLGGVGWSLFHEDYRYWNASLGLTLAGQGGLIFGLVLVVTRLWRSSRYASNKLLDVHARLGELQRTAEALAANRGGAPAFYADLASGAPPQMLLSNLRGQIDQLATRFGAG